MTVSTLVDNDVVVKLARMDAFRDGLAAIVDGGKAGSLRVMLRYMGVADEERRLRLTDGNKAEADRLGAALHLIEETELSNEEASTAAAVMKAVLTEGLDLDQGELMLVVVATRRGGLDVATGDKRAIRSLPALEAEWPDVHCLRQRVICFEQVFASLAAAKGIARVRAAVRASPRADETITFVYEQTSSGGTKRFLEGLEFVIDEHIRRPAPGWLKAL